MCAFSPKDSGLNVCVFTLENYPKSQGCCGKTPGGSPQGDPGAILEPGKGT